MSTIRGTVKEIKEVRNVTETFSVQDVIIETDEKYPQTLLLQMTNNAIQQTEQLNVGDTTDFNINIQGREWKATDGSVKYFTTLNCWSFAEATGGSSKLSNIEKNFVEDEIQQMVDEQEDDFPF